ncbi:polysaccharide biosynthesis/export family protein [Geomonas anaerohicana]|uniref:Polysaccharide export protein n=1 Tax=Geomonas anaerohicana TaxID=2798583 RepID=A0ABS0YHA0_9BACT|nr:polysaccharide biosynthesis/export family protein [Geomonas anaerohicana]MBJ6751627.1 polysaccharide export protein [Geomonas anaerohicana]
MEWLKTFILLVIFAAWGCTSTTTSNRLPLPVATAGAEVKSTYRIQPGDLLDVKFFYNPELNEQVVVRSDGKISLQLINEVIAVGLTPTELTQSLTAAYTKEILEPKVTVIVRTPVADKVYVDGEVNRAGMVTINGTITAVQSIAQAGGMKESANPKTVMVIRRDSRNEISTISLNIEEIRRNGEGDVLLQPNDIVYVPRSSISDINTWIDLYIRKNVPLPIGLGYSIR